jgi:hypothetical protein
MGIWRGGHHSLFRLCRKSKPYCLVALPTDCSLYSTQTTC